MKDIQPAPRPTLLVLTGAGISADSGLATYRGPGGLWTRDESAFVATPEAFDADPERVWRFFGERRASARDARPNAAHASLADAGRRLGDGFLLVTQNIDGLHQQAGSRRVHELHGSLWRTRCSGCDRPPFTDAGPRTGETMVCDRCGGLLRPDVVWFGEPVDKAATEAVAGFIETARSKGRPWMFLAVGTSGLVLPAAEFVDRATRAGASAWLVDLAPGESRSRFAHVVAGRAAEVLPALLVAL